MSRSSKLSKCMQGRVPTKPTLVRRSRPQSWGHVALLFRSSYLRRSMTAKIWDLESLKLRKDTHAMSDLFLPYSYFSKAVNHHLLGDDATIDRQRHYQQQRQR